MLAWTWYVFLGFGHVLLGFCHKWRILLRVDTLHWFDVFGGWFYDALPIGLLGGA